MPKNDALKGKVQDLASTLKELEQKLELSKDQKIIGVEFKDTINLGGDLNRNSIFTVKIKNKNNEITHIIIDKNCNKVADIDKDGKIKLSEKEAELWRQFIGEKEHQSPEQKKRYDFEKEYILEEYKTNEKTVENDESIDSKKDGKDSVGNDAHVVPTKDETKIHSKEDQEKHKAADALNVNETAIISMIKIEDRETFGQAINRKLHADAYIVKYGNNKTKIMQMRSTGDLTELTGLENNEFNAEVMEQLNIDKPKQNQRIKAGDLTVIRTEDPKYSYVVVREHDSKSGIVIVNSGNEAQMYTFDDEGKDDIKEIETSIKYTLDENEGDENEGDENEGERDVKVVPQKDDNLEKDDDEDEGRTPWGDAYARQRR